VNDNLYGGFNEEFIKNKNILNILFNSSAMTANPKNIEVNSIAPLPILLSLLEEQKRIIEKVNLLMNLCDQLSIETIQKYEKNQILQKVIVNL